MIYLIDVFGGVLAGMIPMSGNLGIGIGVVEI